MANVAFTLSPVPGIINDMIAVLYDGAAEIDRLPIPAPHTAPQDLDFINVAPKTYIVKIHETPDGTTLGNLRHDFWVDASLQKLSAYEVKTFQVGQGRGTPYFDPADQDINYINTDLNGLTYMVFKPGYGPLDWATNITPYPGGGFSFTDGQEFSKDETYTLLISNLIMQPLPQTGVGYPSDIVSITADTAFASGHYNNLLEIDASSPVLTITLPPIATIPDGTIFGVNTQKHNGVLRNAVVQLPASASCYVKGVARNVVYVGRSEEVTFVKKGSFLRIVNWDGDVRRLGEKIFSDGDAPDNGLLCDGTWYLKADIPRGFNWYINVLPAGEWASGADDSTPAGDDIYKWIIGANKVRTPDHRDRFYRASKAGRLANSYEDDDNKEHNHVSAPYNRSIARASEAGGNQIPQVDGGNTNPDQKYRVAGMDTARWADATINDQGTESRPKNVAQNVYVII